MKVSNKAWMCSLLISGTIIGIHKDIRKMKEESGTNNKIEYNIDYNSLPNELWTYDYIYEDNELYKFEDLDEYSYQILEEESYEYPYEFYDSLIKEKVKELR